MSDLTHIQAELNAPKNQFNGFGKYKYRNCEDIQSALKPLLLTYSCALTISDSVEVHSERVYMVATATFTDSTGKITEVKAFARESDVKKGMSSEQVSGSASSYARKYCLGGLFLIDDQKDPDSMKPPEPQQPMPAKKEVTPENSQMWTNAKNAYLRDGNFNKVLERANISQENQLKIINECSNV